MKILVIDDNQANQDVARVQLKDHEVTVVGSYDEGQRLVEWTRLVGEKLVHGNHDFEVVLVDLLMPPSDQAQSKRGIWGEMPVGIFLALLAAKNGAKYVAVLTDSSHHAHPASACFDAFNKHESEPTPFTVCGAKMLLCNNRDWVQFFYKNDLSRVFPSNVYYGDKAKYEELVVRAKSWRSLLDYLISEPDAGALERHVTTRRA